MFMKVFVSTVISLQMDHESYNWELTEIFHLAFSYNNKRTRLRMKNRSGLVS